MLILSVGMPRAGSGWHYNLIHDLVVAGGGRDARQIRKRYLLSPILTEVNCNIGALTAKRLLPVMVPVLLGNTFVVKTHGGPKPLALNLIQGGSIKPVYIYRDPRAALLSAYEYGQKGIASGRPNPFSHLESIEDAISFMQDYVRISEEWLVCQDALHVRYEDFVEAFDHEITRLLDFLDITRDQAGLDAVIEKYRPENARQGEPGMHFSKGQPERFREALNSEQLERCKEVFGAYLQKVGYEI